MNKPLALQLAPNSLKEVIGQTHLIGKDKILTNLVKNKKVFSMILYGPPGIGKTSIANALVKDLDVRYRFLNATINNKKDLEIVIEEAKMYDGIVLIMDEIHRLNKDKQDILLPQLESGLITLIGMTTSNPYHAINPAIRSRCQLFELKKLETEDIIKGLKKAIKHPDLKDIKVNSANKTFISENYIISSKNNIFMTNSETKSVDISFYVDGDLSYFNPSLNSKIKTNDNKNNYNLQYSLDINEDNLYLLTNSFDNEYNLKNCSIYKAKLKTDELNNNKGCSIFIFKLSGGIIFLLIWFFIILCVVILIIIMNSGTDLEQTHLLKEMAKEAEINELNRELNG